MNVVGRLLPWVACWRFVSNVYFRTKTDWVRLNVTSTMGKGESPQPALLYFNRLMWMISSKAPRNEEERVGHRLESGYRESHRPTPCPGRIRHRATLSQPT